MHGELDWERIVRYNQIRAREELADPWVILRRWRLRAWIGWLLAAIGWGLFFLTRVK